MQYMLLIYRDPAAVPAQDSVEGQAEFAAWMKLTEDLGKEGVLVAGDALHPVQAATTVRLRGGEPLLTDGPFADTKEELGGYYVVDVEDLDAATAIAARTPNMAYGCTEVRPVMVFG